MTVNHGDYIRGNVIKNLLRANKRLADQGTAVDVIRLSRFMLKLSRQFDKELLELRAEECKPCAESPPDKREKDIAQSE